MVRVFCGWELLKYLRILWGFLSTFPHRYTSRYKANILKISHAMICFDVLFNKVYYWHTDEYRVVVEREYCLNERDPYFQEHLFHICCIKFVFGKYSYSWKDKQDRGPVTRRCKSLPEIINLFVSHYHCNCQSPNPTRTD